MEKLERTQTYVAYSNEIANNDFIDTYYSDLIIDPENALLTNLSVSGTTDKITSIQQPGYIGIEETQALRYFDNSLFNNTICEYLFLFSGVLK